MLPPDPRAMAQSMMGGGAPDAGMAAPASPSAPPMGPPPMDAGMAPDAGAMGAPMGAPPASLPSIDPMVIAQLVAQIKGVQEQDLATLPQMQDAVLAAVMQALSGGPDPAMGVAEGASFGAPEGMPGEPPVEGLY